ncbi:MAG TPA: hypothetical protein VLR49_05620 [Ferruginibacter sp.]|nr:hypothetical protein [Ferruginibacter sp.]
MMKYLSCLIIGVASLMSLTACGQKKFTGTFSNGYKGAKLSFVLSADEKQIKDFTFTGYWRCGGSTENITAGPEKTFAVTNCEVHGVITDPENGGASAFRFSLDGIIKGKTASGTFRMSITGLSCDTYLLNWTAKTK